jgi:hypothetical protein
MARILIYQPLSYLEGYIQFDLSWLFLFDHISNLFPPLEPTINGDDFFNASLFLKKAGLLSDSMDDLSSQEMDFLYTVPKSGIGDKEEFSPAAPARRFKKLMDAKHPEDSHSIYYASNGQFESDYAEGMTPLLKITIKKFPIIDVCSINLEEFIDFLQEPATIEKKRAFYTVLDDIESWILNGEIQIHDIPDLIASRYGDYLNRIGMMKKSFKEKSISLVMIISENILSRLAFIKLSPAIESLLLLARKETTSNREEQNMPNMELAYIAHTNSRFNKAKKPQLIYAV